MVTTMPWVGVPVTTARLAAALFKANVAAERTARMAPNTCDLDRFRQMAGRPARCQPRPQAWRVYDVASSAIWFRHICVARNNPISQRTRDITA
jgi:hypothetical protein